MSLQAATWTGAIATVGLVIGAAVTAIFAIMAFHKQSEEVRVLKSEAARAMGERRRAQATQIFTWADERPIANDADMRPAACLRNASHAPIYDVHLGWDKTAQSSREVLLPDQEHVIPGAGTVIADGKVPVWAEFRDCAGVRWRTTSRGKLTELRTDRSMDGIPD